MLVVQNQNIANDMIKPSGISLKMLNTVFMLVKHKIKKIHILRLFKMHLNVASDDLYQKIMQKLKL